MSKEENVNKEYVSKRVEREEEWKKSEICEFKGCEKCFVEHTCLTISDCVFLVSRIDHFLFCFATLLGYIQQ